MIEPQNTMLPIATQTTAKDTPSGELGFGEMLANTLGMVARFDPSAIAGILVDQGQGDPAGNSEPGSDTAGDDGDGLWMAVTGTVTVPGQNQIVPAPIPPSDAVVVEPVVSPVFPPVREAGELAPVAVVPPTLGDDIAPPVLDELAGDAAVPGVAATTAVAPTATPGPTPVTAQPVPADPRPEPPDGELAPVVKPVGDDAVPVAADGAAVDAPRRADPSALTVMPVEAGDGVPAPTMPPTPIASSAPATNATHVEVAAVDAPVQLPVEPVAVADSGRVSLPDARIELEPGVGTQQPAAPSLENVTGGPGPVSSFTHQAAPAQHSVLAERVLEAVEMQAHQPPPRTMIVDLPELEGIRLVVSVRSGAEVHVVPSSTSTVTDGLRGFMNELDGVLADRGFVMTGDGRRRRENPAPDDQRDLPRRPRPAASRPTDNDLRI